MIYGKKPVLPYFAKQTQSKVKFNKQTESWQVLEPCADWHYLGVEKMDL